MRRSWDDLWLSVAREVSTMSTCVRRDVGCIITDYRNRVLATGVNGVAPGAPHCNPARSVYSDGSEVSTCPGALTAPPGLTENPKQGVTCLAAHAEANALLQCADVWKIHTCYSTVSPCAECTKMLLCTSCVRVVFLEEYGTGLAKSMWHDAVLINKVSPQYREYLKREWIHHKEN